MAYSPTQFQFFHLLVEVYDRLEQTRGLTATSGSSATVVEDTALSADLQTDNFKSQYVFVTHDAAGAGAAPEGEVQLCTAYNETTFKLTTGTFTAAVATGDEVVVIRNSLYPLND